MERESDDDNEDEEEDISGSVKWEGLLRVDERMRWKLVRRAFKALPEALQANTHLEAVAVLSGSEFPVDTHQFDDDSKHVRNMEVPMQPSTRSSMD